MSDVDELIRLSKKYYTEDGTRKPDHYFRVYADVFSSLRQENFNLLELGVSSGASLLIWRDYFPNANIVGLDIAGMPDSIAKNVQTGRLQFVLGDQSNPATLSQCLSKSPTGQFDVIIDDASHIGWLSRASLDFLLPRGLADGGLYFVEDYGTGYTRGFYDGSALGHQGYEPDDRIFPSHSSGMVGWMKQIIDEMHMPYAAPGVGTPLPVADIHFWPSIALIKKIGKNPLFHRR
jgi:hypothetical protein